MGQRLAPLGTSLASQYLQAVGPTPPVVQGVSERRKPQGCAAPEQGRMWGQALGKGSAQLKCQEGRVMGVGRKGPLPTPIPDTSLQEEVPAVELLLVTSVRPCEASQNREAAS